ncbi:MAG: sigma-70 family RNA polymerase sigma factor [Planctomycetota bacterium]
MDASHAASIRPAQTPPSVPDAIAETTEPTKTTETLKKPSDPTHDHRELLHRIARVRVGADAADDVLQEVALAVARSRRRPASPPQLRHWLCAITLRQCALWIRQCSRQSRLRDRAADRLLDQAADRGGADGDPLTLDPIHGLLAAESIDQVRRAYSQMPRESAQLLNMKIVQGMTYPDIAAATGLSRHTVEYRITVARQELRLRMVRQGIQPEP